MMTPPKFRPCWILWKFVGHDSTHPWTIFTPTCINHFLSWFVQIDFILNSHLWVHLSSILKFSFLFSILELNNTFKIKATLQHWKHLYKQPSFASWTTCHLDVFWNEIVIAPYSDIPLQLDNFFFDIYHFGLSTRHNRL
jgi:hypothetical protein